MRSLTNQRLARTPSAISSASTTSSAVSLTSPSNNTVKRSASVRHQQGVSLSSAWDDVALIATPSTSRLQRANNMRGHTTDTTALGKRSRLCRAATADSSSRKGRSGQVVITSSDSSDGVECIPVSSRTARPARNSLPIKAAPIVLDDDEEDDDDDFVQVGSRRKSQRVSYSAMFCRNNSNAGSSCRRNSNSSDCLIDDSEGDIQVVLPSTPIQAGNSSAPGQTKNKKHKEIFMPSSPQLLHPSSPTILRYNSQSSQPNVLSEPTQNAVFSVAKGAISSTADTFEGSTLVSSSGGRSNTAGLLGRHCNQVSLALDLIKEMELTSAPSSSASASANVIPETPRMSPLHMPQKLPSPSDLTELQPLPLPLPLPLPPAQQNHQQRKQRNVKQRQQRQLLQMPPDVQRYLQTDLPSDPISEFGTPANSPPGSRVAEFPHNSKSRLRPCDNEGIDCYEYQQDSVDSRSGSLAEPPSITQWYHEGLSKCNEEEAGGGEHESSEYTQSESLELDDPEDDSLHMGDDMGNTQSILIDDDDDDDDDEVSEEGGHENKDDDDVGYSSPLEGFWDLRNSDDWSTQDRDMYINQFAPSKRQVALRKRAQGKRDAVHSSINNSSSDVGGHGDGNGPQGMPAQIESASGATKNSRRRKGSKRSSSTRKRTPKSRSGRGGASRSTRGGRLSKGRKKSAIRPMASSRARAEAAQPPLPPSSTSTGRAASSSAAVVYNYYDDKPFLDIAPSFNWEGGGIARFG